MKNITFFIVMLLFPLGLSCKKHETGKNERMLFSAIEIGDIQKTKKLIKDGVNVNVQYKGNFPLSLAAKKGNINIVKLLIKNGATPQATKYGMTPLKGAIYSGNPKIIKYLIENGDDVNFKNYVGQSILMEAAKGADPNIVRLLLDNGAKVNDKAKDNTSALYELISAIRYSGFKPLKASSKIDYINYIKTLRLLIEAGADVNNSNTYGVTCLVVATHLGKVQVVEILIEAGADVNKIDKKRTPLDYAIKNKFKECIELLRKHGAKTGAELDKEKGVIKHQLPINDKH